MDSVKSVIKIAWAALILGFILVIIDLIVLGFTINNEINKNKNVGKAEPLTIYTEDKEYTDVVSNIEETIKNDNEAISYTEEEILLAQIVYAESRGCSDECQIAVASVVMNRVNSSLYPNTIYDVIYQDGQYEPAWTGSINVEPDEQAMKNAHYVYTNGSQIPYNVTFQSLFEQGSGVWNYIDNTYFCYQ